MMNDNENLEKRYNYLLNKLRDLNYVDNSKLSEEQKNELLLKKTQVVDELDKLKKKLKID